MIWDALLIIYFLIFCRQNLIINPFKDSDICHCSGENFSTDVAFQIKKESYRQYFTMQKQDYVKIILRKKAKIWSIQNKDIIICFCFLFFFRRFNKNIDTETIHKNVFSGNKKIVMYWKKKLWKQSQEKKKILYQSFGRKQRITEKKHYIINVHNFGCR